MKHNSTWKEDREVFAALCLAIGGTVLSLPRQALEQALADLPNDAIGAGLLRGGWLQLMHHSADIDAMCSAAIGSSRDLLSRYLTPTA